MLGIYKIESPSGKVYIGQSVNIVKRWGWYRAKACKSQKRLSRSFIKYGVEAHTFSVLHELPKDVGKEVLTRYENFYIDVYGDVGYQLLNLSAGKESRYGAKLTEGQREKDGRNYIKAGN